jgi:5-enolpyruvylshikimate-3-phosphate synthase
LAMAFGLLSRGLPGLVVQNPEVVSKSWPDYFDALKAFYF